MESDKVTDDEAVLLSKDIARKIEESLNFPGPDQGDRDPGDAGGGTGQQVIALATGSGRAAGSCIAASKRASLHARRERRFMANLVDVLRERGFIDQTTHEQELIDYFERQPGDRLHRVRPHRVQPAHRQPGARSCRWPTCSGRATGRSRWWAAAPAWSGTPAARPRCARCSPLEEVDAQRRRHQAAAVAVPGFQRRQGAAAQQRRVADPAGSTSRS
ncbi:MAG: hypothetical protein MZV70_50375 [Desulfobacterales bacterium]|nr:hypothetical protein [Desulfobacterales bacterium]